jgi:hypothetical protein
MGTSGVDRDGVRREETPAGGGRWLLLGAGGFTALCLGACLWLLSAPAGEDVEEVAFAPAPAPAPAPTAARARPPRREAHSPVMADLARPELPPEEEPMAPPLFESSGEGGLAVFPARGTKPVLRGLVVPDDFEVPEGFVRHFQTSEEGERLEAILLFHPDATPRDRQGNQVPMPANRVVPPELAPPGLPLRFLHVPGDAVRTAVAE